MSSLRIMNESHYGPRANEGPFDVVHEIESEYQANISQNWASMPVDEQQECFAFVTSGWVWGTSLEAQIVPEIIGGVIVQSSKGSTQVPEPDDTVRGKRGNTKAANKLKKRKSGPIIRDSREAADTRRHRAAEVLRSDRVRREAMRERRHRADRRQQLRETEWHRSGVAEEFYQLFH
ncbi:hypothetical protein CKM354_001292500 [Cercospora kikuchii]|uniref:Uncharacterized protein n=1 Tax=Cercospora kikuchii TaxID=84275 RepID=A0A9P3FMW2_9PEZI|nr:uncharacterized protein CKM354_001292500 [Cercospora kikuchii]GIZ49908.1 hypothetical protein CKM354_001292500 [Cercospora kikuchii]